MADTQFAVAPGIRLNGDGDFAAMARGAEISRVWIWDCGPPKPTPPKRPVPPEGKDGESKYELAKLDFREALEAYDAELRTFQQRKREFADFETRFGGPYLIAQWSADAQETFAHDERAVREGRQEKKRYYMSSRTRGYQNLPNGGLPAVMKPGHGHEENLRREREGEADIAYAKKNDPVFGQEKLRQ